MMIYTQPQWGRTEVDETRDTASGNLIVCHGK